MTSKSYINPFVWYRKSWNQVVLFLYKTKNNRGYWWRLMDFDPFTKPYSLLYSIITWEDLPPCTDQSTFHQGIFREKPSKQSRSLQTEWPKYINICYLDDSLVMKNPYIKYNATNHHSHGSWHCALLWCLTFLPPRFHGEHNGSKNANSP